MATTVYTAPRRLYLDAQGKVVEADDPNRVSLLVAQGGTLPLAEAERYGLITVDQTITHHDEKAVKAPAANKAMKAAPADKSK